MVLAFRDHDTSRLSYDAFERGAWQGSPTFIGTGVQVKISSYPYSNRFSVVYSSDYDVQHATVVTAASTVTATPTATPPPPPPPTATPTPSAPIGALSLNGGSSFTTKAGVTGVISNSGGPATNFVLTIDGQPPVSGAFAADGKGPQTIPITLPAGAGCIPTTVNGTLTGPGGTSSFNATIMYEPQLTASAVAVNPALRSNNRRIGVGPSEFAGYFGDQGYTREPFFYLYIDPKVGQCSPLDAYYVGIASDVFTTTSDPRWKKYEPGTAPIFAIPGAAPQQGLYSYKVFLRDVAGNFTTNTANGQPALDVSIVLDQKPPVASIGAGSSASSTIPATGTGKSNDVARLDLTSLVVSDTPDAGSAPGYAGYPGGYWGTWLLVNDKPTVEVGDPSWISTGIVRQGRLGPSVDYNLFFGQAGPNRPTNTPLYVHLRFIDGAGNAGNVLNSTAVTPTQYLSGSSQFVAMIAR
ncbi:MAG: hypothetical protein NVS2B7_18870 [Herpetosiphon sp.]